MGYWFPHRKGGGACEHGKQPNIDMALARRRGEDPLQVLADFLWNEPGEKTTVCPF